MGNDFRPSNSYRSFLWLTNTTKWWLTGSSGFASVWPSTASSWWAPVNEASFSSNFPRCSGVISRAASKYFFKMLPSSTSMLNWEIFSFVSLNLLYLDYSLKILKNQIWKENNAKGRCFLPGIIGNTMNQSNCTASVMNILFHVKKILGNSWWIGLEFSILLLWMLFKLTIKSTTFI